MIFYHKKILLGVPQGGSPLKKCNFKSLIIISDHPAGRKHPKRPKHAEILGYFGVCPNQLNRATVWTFWERGVSHKARALIHPWGISPVKVDQEFILASRLFPRGSKNWQSCFFKLLRTHLYLSPLREWTPPPCPLTIWLSSNVPVDPQS